MEKDRAALSSAGQKALAARALHPERSLAQHHSPPGTDPALLNAYDALDTVMDKIMGASRRYRTELKRQELLFLQYARRTARRGRPLAPHADGPSR